MINTVKTTKWLQHSDVYDDEAFEDNGNKAISTTMLTFEVAMT